MGTRVRHRRTTPIPSVQATRNIRPRYRGSKSSVLLVHLTFGNGGILLSSAETYSFLLKTNLMAGTDIPARIWRVMCGRSVHTTPGLTNDGQRFMQAIAASRRSLFLPSGRWKRVTPAPTRTALQEIERISDARVR